MYKVRVKTDNVLYKVRVKPYNMPKHIKNGKTFRLYAEAYNQRCQVNCTRCLTPLKQKRDEMAKTILY